MSSSFSLEAWSPSPPDHCEPQNDFLLLLSSYSHTCIPSNLAFISTLLGSLSIVSWLFAQLPQIFKNYSLKSTSGLSIFFLVEWCLGDASNLLGALFTKQAAWQVVVAGYYVCVDMMLVAQWLWYEHLYHGRSKGMDLSFMDGRGDGNDRGTGAVLIGISPSDSGSEGRRSEDSGRSDSKKAYARKISSGGDNVFHTPNFSDSPPTKEKATSSSPFGASTTAPRTIHRLQHSASPMPSPKTILCIALLITLVSGHPSPSSSNPLMIATQSSPTATETAGTILSWTSTLLYLGSRLPQLYKNHSRRSTAGLSAALFIAAFFGNLFYSASLLTNPCAWSSFPAYGGGGWVGEEGSERWDWVGRAVPFWLGAAGVLALDATVGLQFLMFRVVEGDEEEVGEMVLRDEDEGESETGRGRGRWRWRRVSGWMRGWVPSPSPSDRAAVEPDGGSGEEQGLLSRGEGENENGAAEYGSI
ncbi:MAG: hypothetical protein M1819_000400 [Sarea resinae]|nr:MAG: hypothetical protein M1819_000400 [Sarea resinae]